MVATITIQNDTAGTDNNPGATGAVTNLRYKEADNNTQDLVNPVTIPPSSTKHSFWKSCFFEVTTAGGFTQIDNINIWVDTFNWTGVTLNIGDQFPLHTLAATTGYDVADALAAITTHTDITTVTDHGATHTSSGTAIGPITIGETANLIQLVNETSHYWVTSIEVGVTGVAGTQTARTVNVEYDEI